MTKGPIPERILQIAIVTTADAELQDIKNNDRTKVFENPPRTERELQELAAEVEPQRYLVLWLHGKRVAYVHPVTPSSFELPEDAASDESSSSLDLIVDFEE